MQVSNRKKKLLKLASISRNTAMNFFMKRSKIAEIKPPSLQQTLPKINKDMLRKYIKSGLKKTGLGSSRKSSYFKKSVKRAQGTCCNFYS